MIFLTSPGKTYSVNSVSGCTISADGTTIATIPANVQTTFIAPEEEVLVSDNNAIIVEVTGVGAGGSGGSGEGGSGGVTAEEIKAVVPMAFGTWNTKPSATRDSSIAIGSGASSDNGGISIGAGTTGYQTDVVVGGSSKGQNNYVTIMGSNSIGSGIRSTNVGYGSKNNGSASISIGAGTNSKAAITLTLGASFDETVDGTNVTHTCETQGTGSITIGAGANTLNNGTTESSNSVTIGCKALNQGADSVVIGALSNTSGKKAIIIGSGINGSGNQSISINGQANGIASQAIGSSSYAAALASTAIGHGATVTSENGLAVGHGANVYKKNAVAVGFATTVSDYGAIAFRSTAEDGTYTQLYFSGANTPLANTYHDGAPMLGYVTKDSAGNIVAAGTRSLIDLLTDNSTFAPASLDENGERVMPKVFHPSDLDMPQEEPSEGEEYTPLPVYPIVEPEIEEIHSES